jgi:MSHA biogenesis protein MshI
MRSFSLREMLPRRSGSSPLAVDIRPGSIGLCQVDTEGRPSLWEHIPLQESQARVAGRVEELLSGIVRRHHLVGSRSIAVLHRPDYQLILAASPAVPRGEREAALRWQVAERVGFPLEEAVLDTVDLPAAADGEGQVYAVVARRGVTQAHCGLLRNAGLVPIYVDIAEMAQRNLAALLPEDERGVALLDVAADSVLLTVTQDAELLFSRVLSAGSDAMLQALTGNGALTREVASAYLEHQGLRGAPAGEATGAPGLEDTGPALSRAVEQLALEVYRSLDYYQTHFRRDMVRRMYLGFSATPIAGLAEYLEQRVGVECRDFPSVRISGTTHGRMNGQRLCLLSYGAALRELLS